MEGPSRGSPSDFLLTYFKSRLEENEELAREGYARVARELGGRKFSHVTPEEQVRFQEDTPSLRKKLERLAKQHLPALLEQLQEKLAEDERAASTGRLRRTTSMVGRGSSEEPYVVHRDGTREPLASVFEKARIPAPEDAAREVKITYFSASVKGDVALAEIMRGFSSAVRGGGGAAAP